MEQSIFGSTVKRESVCNIDMFVGDIPASAEYLGSVNNGYHAAYADKYSLTVFEYCEGDMTTISSHDETQFEKEVQRTRSFILDN